MKYLLALLLIPLLAQADPDPNKHYHLATRCWLPYEADGTTLALYHLVDKHAVDVEDLMLDVLDDAPPAATLQPGGNIVDASVYKRNAVAEGLTPESNGRFGAGLRFPAEGDARFKAPTNLSGKGWQGTAEAWFQPTKVTAGTPLIVLAMRSSQHLVLSTDGAGRLAVQLGDAALGATEMILPADTWTHVALQVRWAKYRVDAGSGRLYPQEAGIRLLINGAIVLDLEEAQHPELARLWKDSCDSVWIGSSPASKTHLVGVIDEIRLSSDARDYYPWQTPPTFNARPETLAWPYLRSRDDLVLEHTFDQEETP